MASDSTVLEAKLVLLYIYIHKRIQKTTYNYAFTFYSQVQPVQASYSISNGFQSGNKNSINRKLTA